MCLVWCALVHILLLLYVTIAAMCRYELSWVKLRAWELTDFDVVLLLDADVTIMGDISALFTLPTHFAAVPDQQFNDPAIR